MCMVFEKLFRRNIFGNSRKFHPYIDFYAKFTESQLLVYAKHMEVYNYAYKSMIFMKILRKFIWNRLIQWILSENEIAKGPNNYKATPFILKTLYIIFFDKRWSRFCIRFQFAIREDKFYLVIRTFSDVCRLWIFLMEEKIQILNRLNHKNTDPKVCKCAILYWSRFVTVNVFEMDANLRLYGGRGYIDKMVQ